MSGAPARAGVIGWPVSHSLSPLMMGAWIADAGLAGTYEPIAAAPEAFAGAVAGLRARGYAGVNVTLPHKEAALALADHPSDRHLGPCAAQRVQQRQHVGDITQGRQAQQAEGGGCGGETVHADC